MIVVGFLSEPSMAANFETRQGDQQSLTQPTSRLLLRAV